MPLLVDIVGRDGISGRSSTLALAAALGGSPFSTDMYLPTAPLQPSDHAVIVPLTAGSSLVSHATRVTECRTYLSWYFTVSLCTVQYPISNFDPLGSIA